MLRNSLLSSAVAAVVDARLPGLTPVNRGLPKTEMRKTNPPPSQPGAKAPGSVPNSIAPPSPIGCRAVDPRLPGLTTVNRGLPNAANGKTNPPSRAGPDPSLTTQKLAAARLLAWGRTTPQVAAELGISRQAVWKWRRNSAFVAEVRRIHERISLRPPLAASRV